MSQHSLRLPDELMESVDQARGLVPRNAWIVATLREQLQPVPVYETRVLDPGELVQARYGTVESAPMAPLSRAESFARATQRKP